MGKSHKPLKGFKKNRVFEMNMRNKRIKVEEKTDKEKSEQIKIDRIKQIMKGFKNETHNRTI